MSLRLWRGGGICALLSLTLYGCATSRLDSAEPLFTDPEELSVHHSEEAGRLMPGPEPGWRRVIYRGEVRWHGVAGTPIEGAIISVCDGGEIYHSTLSDEHGGFVLPVDLYGTPEGGTWKPETYYALLARTPSGEWTKRRLRNVDMGEPLTLEIERARASRS